MRSTIFRTAAALAAIGAVAAPNAVAGTFTGPSTSSPPVVLPDHPNVDVTSILRTGDAVPRKGGGAPYVMAGTPDGGGAFPNRAGRTRYLINHEFGPGAGAVHKHGAKGSFVSDWSLNASTLAVESGDDLVRPYVTFWDYPSGTYTSHPSTGGPNPNVPGDTFVAQDRAFARFCSSSLTAPGALMNPSTGNGYPGQMYFANEENGDGGRLFAVTDYGLARQLPRAGMFSYENTQLAATTSDATVVMGLEDGGSGQLRTYVGEKASTGTPWDKAGLTNGEQYVWDAVDQSVSTDAEFRALYGKGYAAPVELKKVDWNQSGARQNADAETKGLSLNRIEDGEFDPRNPNDFYFVTTAGGDRTPNPDEGLSRDGGGLWKLSFVDVNDPSRGATLTLLLDGTEAPYLSEPDNIGIDREGNLLIQEDPGGSPHLARIVAYKIPTGRLGVLATFDPALFGLGAPGLLTTNEESSGIIDTKTQLGRGTFLFGAQIHRSLPGELVEDGQMLMLKVNSWAGIYTYPGR